MRVSDIISAVSGANVGERQSKIWSGEAHVLWETLQQRYDYYEFSQVLLHNVSDSEFKALAGMGIQDTMKAQITKLEGLLNTFGLPQPKQPPGKIIESGETDVWRDELIFNLLLVGVQNFMDVHLRGIKLFMNDGLRNLYNGFLVDELKAHDNLVKYGKLKGWVQSPPAYSQRA